MTENAPQLVNKNKLNSKISPGGAYAGPPDWREVSYLLNDYLTAAGLLIGTSNGSFGMYKISPDGYTNLQQLREANTPKAHEDSQIGFCAMWFDDTVKNAWTVAISKAMGQAGYKPMRIDEHQHNNKIDDEISAMIRRSRFVVADFTGQRGGVYFEAGFAVGLGVPVIWTCRKDDLNNVHFDNRQYNFLLWMPEELERFKCDLQNRIEQTLGKGKYVGAS